MRSKGLALTALFFVLIFGAIACRQEPPGPVAGPQSQSLVDLESVEQLRTEFNENAGEPRLLLILAPI